MTALTGFLKELRVGQMQEYENMVGTRGQVSCPTSSYQPNPNNQVAGVTLAYRPAYPKKNRYKRCWVIFRN